MDTAPGGRPDQMGVYANRYLEKQRRRSQSGHSDFGITLLFSGSLGRAKRRQGCPVEGHKARNELELIVMP